MSIQDISTVRKDELIRAMFGVHVKPIDYEVREDKGCSSGRCYLETADLDGNPTGLKTKYRTFIYVANVRHKKWERKVIAFELRQRDFKNELKAIRESDFGFHCFASMDNVRKKAVQTFLVWKNSRNEIEAMDLYKY